MARDLREDVIFLVADMCSRDTWVLRTDTTSGDVWRRFVALERNDPAYWIARCLIMSVYGI